MNERDAQDRLRDLGKRLASAQGARRQREPEPGDTETGGNALAQGWRIGIELVVAVAVGVGIGLAIDHWRGTRYWVVVFFFLGVAAGMVNVWRAVKGMGMAVGYQRSGTTAAPSAAPGKIGPDEAGNTGPGWSEDED
jgi:ATP synthase protein I